MLDASGFGEIRRGTITIEDIAVGMIRGLRKTVTEEDLEMFARISGDRNPVHFDDEYARQTIFGGRIAHGMLTASLISAIIGEQLPGHGTIYMKQNLTFMAPVKIGDVVQATVTVADIVDYAKRRVALRCACHVDDAEVLRGDALVMAPTARFD
jgi:3-hydroxybutyryl-CoA dehydratase